MNKNPDKTLVLSLTYLASTLIFTGAAYFLQGCGDYKPRSETYFSCSATVHKTLTREELIELQNTQQEFDIDSISQASDGTETFNVTISQCNSTTSDDDTAAGTVVVGLNGEPTSGN